MSVNFYVKRKKIKNKVHSALCKINAVLLPVLNKIIYFAFWEKISVAKFYEDYFKEEHFDKRVISYVKVTFKAFLEQLICQFCKWQKAD